MGGTHLYLCQTLLRTALGPRPAADTAVDRLTTMLLSGDPCARCGVCRISPNINLLSGAGADQTMDEVHIVTLHTGGRLVVTKNENGKYVRALPNLEDSARHLEPEDDDPDDNDPEDGDGSQSLPGTPGSPDDNGGPPSPSTGGFAQLPLFD